MDEGRKFYFQYGCLDKRNEQGLFISTSIGSVMHLDLRLKKKITFQAYLDEKKINTISLHPNGTTLATGGLSTMIKLFDIRKLSNTSLSDKKNPRSFARLFASKSVNSAFFSPSGSYLLATTMANNLDILKDAHLAKEKINSPTQRIKHDNLTGRWLTTFHAVWHKSHDVFTVGCMKQPRQIEIFNGTNGKLIKNVQGDVLTSVASRCCFYGNGGEDFGVLGGNSSGRVYVLRK